MIPASAYAAFDPQSPLKYWDFERRAVRPDDVEIDILFCGVCHSDLHAARGEWGEMNRPFVPGHEIVGRVAAVGDQVTAHKVGDLVVREALVVGARDLGTRLTWRRETHVYGPVIYAGIAPYFAYSVLYDPRRQAIGLKPRPPGHDPAAPRAVAADASR